MKSALEALFAWDGATLRRTGSGCRMEQVEPVGLGGGFGRNGIERRQSLDVERPSIFPCLPGHEGRHGDVLGYGAEQVSRALAPEQVVRTHRRISSLLLLADGVSRHMRHECES